MSIILVTFRILIYLHNSFTMTFSSTWPNLSKFSLWKKLLYSPFLQTNTIFITFQILIFFQNIFKGILSSIRPKLYIFTWRKIMYTYKTLLQMNYRFVSFQIWIFLKNIFTITFFSLFKCSPVFWNINKLHFDRKNVMEWVNSNYQFFGVYEGCTNPSRYLSHFSQTHYLGITYIYSKVIFHILKVSRNPLQMI